MNLGAFIVLGESGAWPLQAAAVVGLLAGVAMWLIGGRVIRPLLAALGAAFGSASGWGLGVALGGVINPLVPMAVGGVTGLLIAVAAFRLAMALTLGAAMGLVLPVAAAAWIVNFGSPLEDTGEGEGETPSLFLDGVPLEEELRDARERFDTLSEQARRVMEGGEALGSEEASAASEAVDRVEAFAHELGAEIGPLWASLPVGDRMLLILSAVTGMAVGVAIGMILPSSAAALVASGSGAAIWLACGAWLAATNGAWGSWLPDRPATWLVVWIGLWVVGAVLQFVIVRRVKKKPEKEATGD